MGNTFKTALLLTGLTLALLLMGSALGGRTGMTIALVMAGVMNLVSYFYSDKIALSMYRAQPIAPGELPRVWNIMDRLVARTGLPMPKLYVIPDMSPNAFATGRNPKHASVAVTQGILQLLNDEELEGVLAHELAHIRNRDILIASVAATLAGAITYLAQMGHFAAIFGGMRGDDNDGPHPAVALLMFIMAPIAAMLIQLAVSRSREYAADATAAGFTGNPYGLAKALEKLHGYSRRLPMHAEPATAHMFIVAPFTGSSIMSLFSTHPPMEKRIERLVGRGAFVA